MKRAVCLLLCAVIFVFAAGCSAAPLTADEYFDEFSSASKNFVESSKALMDDLMNKNFDTPLFTAANDSLDRLEGLSPPKEYAELHQRLLDGIKIEREVILVMKETLELAAKAVYETDVSDEEMAKLQSGTERMRELSDDTTFTDAMTAIIKKYKEENP